MSKLCTFSIRDLGIHGYWYLQQMLEPAPHRYWEMTVRGVWSSHLKLPFSQQTFLSIYSNPILWDADKQGTLPIIEELDISEEPDVERNTSGRKYVTLDVCVNCFGKQREHHLFYIGEHGKASQRGHWGWVYRVEEDRTLGRGNSVHLISVLGGMWQIMFTQGDKSFSLKKKVLSEFQVIHIRMSPALTFGWTISSRKVVRNTADAIELQPDLYFTGMGYACGLLCVQFQRQRTCID